MNSDFRQVVQDTRRLLHDVYHSQKAYLSLILGIVLGFIVGIVLAVLFYELFDALRDKELGYFDSLVSSFVHELRSPVLTDMMLFITDLGDRTGFMVVGFLLLIFFYFRYRSLIFPMQTGLVLIVAGGLNRWLKSLIERQRPEANSLLEETSLSFPSGHAMGSIAFYGFLIYLTWRLTPNSPLLRWMLSFLLLLLILLIGFSRVYLGVHYPSDVLAGYAAGGACLAIFIAIFSYVRYRYARMGIDTRVTEKEQQ
jgi:membrane-associated phospholipid phosphatase